MDGAKIGMCVAKNEDSVVELNMVYTEYKNKTSVVTSANMHLPFQNQTPTLSTLS